ncbi:phage holin [Staphylococcus felis]|uniref:phage holin n=1 Tax=Staphylococcus felis TaxID=46127 RepID=UPI003966ECF1
MKNINWKVRFNKKNINFILRFIAAIFVPAFASVGIDFNNLTSWNALGDALLQLITNPVVLALMIYNALNMIPDPTTKGIGDSGIAQTYKQPRDSTNPKELVDWHSSEPTIENNK